MTKRKCKNTRKILTIEGISQEKVGAYLASFHNSLDEIKDYINDPKTTSLTAKDAQRITKIPVDCVEFVAANFLGGPTSNVLDRLYKQIKIPKLSQVVERGEEIPSYGFGEHRCSSQKRNPYKGGTNFTGPLGV